MSTQVILLERVEHLGAMGDVVGVKPGYARNYLLPQKKALRATKENIAYFETQKATLEKANNEKKKGAETEAKKLDGLKIAIIRQASEGGQLYGSVTSRDIAEAITEASKVKIERYMVELNQNFKSIGLFTVPVALHPEVKVEMTINIARSEDEAATQEKTGKALIAAEGEAVDSDAAEAAAEEAKSELMEEGALEAEKEAEAEAAVKEAEAVAKAEAKAAKKAAKADDESLELAEMEGETEAAVAEANEEAEEEQKEEKSE